MNYAKYTRPYIRDKAKLAEAYYRMGVLEERLAEQRRKRQQLERRLSRRRSRRRDPLTGAVEWLIDGLNTLAWNAIRWLFRRFEHGVKILVGKMLFKLRKPSR